MRASRISRYVLVVVAGGVSAAVCSAALSGCGAAPKAPPAAPVAAAPCPPAPAPAAPAAAPQESLLERVPAAAVAAVILRRGGLGLPRSFLEGAPGMRRDLATYLTREVGIDPTGVEGLVAWTTNPAARTGAIFVRLPTTTGRLLGRRVGQHRGVDLVEVDPAVVAAVLDGGVVLGSPTEVATAIDLNRGQAEPLGSASPLGFLRAAAAPDVDIVGGAHLPSVVDPALGGLVQAAGLDSLLVTFTRAGLITARVRGDRERLGAVREMFKAGVGLAVSSLERAKDEALGKHDVGKAVGAIVGYHQAKKLSTELEPRIDGDSLVSQYQLPKLSGSEMILFYGGMAAAIAIPAFVKYVRRAKEAEGRANVRRLAEAALHLKSPHRKPARAVGRYEVGRRFEFPATTPWTPAAECCKTGGKCRPDPAAWSHPTWQALGFSMAEPHYYQYRFASEGKGKKAAFHVEARARLDCDKSDLSTFRVTGTVQPDGGIVTGTLERKGD